MKFRTAVGIAALLGLGAMVRADTISYSDNTDIPATTTDWSSSLAFPQFNSIFGTLNSVELDLNGSLQTQLTVTNEADSGSSGSVNTELQVTVQDPGTNLTAPELDMLSPSYSYSLGAGGSSSSGLLTKSSSTSNVYTLPAVLAEFTGAGNMSLAASTFTQTLLANTGGNTASGQVTTASLNGEVIYNYTPVPEPGSLGLVVLGGMLLGRRRRR